MSSTSPEAGTLATGLRAAWHGFLKTYEPLRPDLYRYCRHLTRSPWDAEDLVQDALARAFVTLGQLGEPPPNPRAWLLRVASNLWLDQLRRLRVQGRDHHRADEDLRRDDERSTREAAGTLLGQLAPRERAALVLKDVFDLSLEEVAESLSTTTGAVKAALHRGRGKLQEPPAETLAAPPRVVLDRFCAAFNAGDLEQLTRLLLDTASVEVVGATTQYGQEAARRTVLFGMLFGGARLARGHDCSIEDRFTQRVLSSAPRVEARLHRDEWLLVHWYQHEDGEAVRAITRLEVEGACVRRLCNYFFNPDFIGEVCRELGLPFRSNGYRWFMPEGDDDACR